MRAMFMVVASVILAAGLFGCNRKSEAPVAAPVTVVTPPAAVPPPPPPPPPPAAEESQRYRHHRTSYSAQESESTESYSEYSSSESYSGEDYSAEDSQVDVRGASQGGEAIWVDGFGRSHYATTTQADENPALLAPEDQRDRDSVWHGYEYGR